MKIKLLDLAPSKEHGKLVKKLFEAKQINFTYEEFADNHGAKILDQVKLLQADPQQRLVVISDNSALTFMLLAKHKDIVVAEISDAHSAYMTMLHNNANVLALSSLIMSPENTEDVVSSYLKSHFEAGRHMVRINMMNKIIEGGSE